MTHCHVVQQWNTIRHCEHVVDIRDARREVPLLIAAHFERERKKSGDNDHHNHNHGHPPHPVKLVDLNNSSKVDFSGCWKTFEPDIISLFKLVYRSDFNRLGFSVGLFVVYLRVVNKSGQSTAMIAL